MMARRTDPLTGGSTMVASLGACDLGISATCGENHPILKGWFMVNHDRPIESLFTVLTIITDMRIMKHSSRHIHHNIPAIYQQYKIAGLQTSKHHLLILIKFILHTVSSLQMEHGHGRQPTLLALCARRVCHLTPTFHAKHGTQTSRDGVTCISCVGLKSWWLFF